MIDNFSNRFSSGLVLSEISENIENSSRYMKASIMSIEYAGPENESLETKESRICDKINSLDPVEFFDNFFNFHTVQFVSDQKFEETSQLIQKNFNLNNNLKKDLDKQFASSSSAFASQSDVFKNQSKTENITKSQFQNTVTNSGAANPFSAAQIQSQASPDPSNRLNSNPKSDMIYYSKTHNQNNQQTNVDDGKFQEAHNIFKPQIQTQVMPNLPIPNQINQTVPDKDEKQLNTTINIGLSDNSSHVNHQHSLTSTGVLQQPPGTTLVNVNHKSRYYRVQTNNFPQSKDNSKAGINMPTIQSNSTQHSNNTSAATPKGPSPLIFSKNNSQNVSLENNQDQQDGCAQEDINQPAAIGNQNLSIFNKKAYIKVSNESLFSKLPGNETVLGHPKTTTNQQVDRENEQKQEFINYTQRISNHQLITSNETNKLRNFFKEDNKENVPENLPSTFKSANNDKFLNNNKSGIQSQIDSLINDTKSPQLRDVPKVGKSNNVLKEIDLNRISEIHKQVDNSSNNNSFQAPFGQVLPTLNEINRQNHFRIKNSFILDISDFGQKTGAINQKNKDNNNQITPQNNENNYQKINQQVDDKLQINGNNKKSDRFRSGSMPTDVKEAK